MEKALYDEIDLTITPCFGVAGNFTGHLEQAGEAKDFASVVTKEANEPKALFPTYIPNAGTAPEFLNVFPFDPTRIIFPKSEDRFQIEPECAIVCKAEWKDGNVVSLIPEYFGASNDCSIRREGAKKISEKKNWGNASKGLSANLIPIDSFDQNGIMSRYRIASFLVRGDSVHVYGEDSRISDYSYIWGKLLSWILDKLNSQQDSGPAENVNSYLRGKNYPEHIMISIGATRYTDFGEHNFLQNGDACVVALYPENYTSEQIFNFVKKGDFSMQDISFLVQTCQVL